ncbi:hypothetical protein V8F33_013895 [Rhypophila sp. PSN 637]
MVPSPFTGGWLYNPSLFLGPDDHVNGAGLATNTIGQKERPRLSQPDDTQERRVTLKKGRPRTPGTLKERDEKITSLQTTQDRRVTRKKAPKTPDTLNERDENINSLQKKLDKALNERNEKITSL